MRLLIVFLLVACTAAEADEKLREAADLHNHSMEVGHRASLLVAQLKRQEAMLSDSQQDSLQSIMQALGEWYDTVVEVPGFDHEEEHHDHFGHTHDHGEKLNYLEGLSSEEVLEVQQALKREVERIEARVASLARSIQNTTGR